MDAGVGRTARPGGGWVWQPRRAGDARGSASAPGHRGQGPRGTCPEPWFLDSPTHRGWHQAP
eukprot:3207861-Lingulodinium_polyedra.AAC.1